MARKIDAHETRFRSVVKGIVWRALASMATMGLVYIFTGKLKLSLEVGAIEVVLKLILYYGHERAWDVISWGRVAPEAEERATLSTEHAQVCHSAERFEAK